MSILARYIGGRNAATQNAMAAMAPQDLNPMGAMGGMPAGDGAAGYGGGDIAPSGDPTLSLIREFEGFRETPYWDVNALRTGYGSDTITMPDGTVKQVGEGTRVSREDADRDLQRRVQTEFMPIAAKAVGDDIFTGLAPNQKAALTSIAYNYGKLPSSVATAVRGGDPNAVATAIAALGSHNDGINRSRREREASIYLGNPMATMAGT